MSCQSIWMARARTTFFFSLSLLSRIMTFTSFSSFHRFFQSIVFWWIILRRPTIIEISLDLASSNQGRRHNQSKKGTSSKLTLFKWLDWKHALTHRRSGSMASNRQSVWARYSNEWLSHSHQVIEERVKRMCTILLVRLYLFLTYGILYFDKDPWFMRSYSLLLPAICTM